MDKLSVLYCFVLLPINILNAPAEAGDCSTGPHSKNQTCCTNYYPGNGVCESCSTGFFGMNCSTRCQYPYFGHLCNGTCKCNATECNHVNGCQGNDTENAATIGLLQGKIKRQHELLGDLFGWYVCFSIPMENISLIWRRPHLNIHEFLATAACSIGQHSQNVDCCTHYFLDNGICKACLPGFFGMNCSRRCPYPNFGYLCNGTCQCDETYCSHAHGCYEKSTGKPILTECSSGFYGQNCSSQCRYPNFGYLCNDSCQCDATECHHVTGCQRNITEKGTTLGDTSSNTTISPTSNRHQRPESEASEHFKIATICIGTILTILLVVTAATWLLKSIRRKCTIHNDGVDTIYVEINGESDQGRGLNTIVVSLDDVQTRPELPVRNKPDKVRPSINTVKDDVVQE